jgi:hypothetical protein
MNGRKSAILIALLVGAGLSHVWRYAEEAVGTEATAAEPNLANDLSAGKRSLPSSSTPFHPVDWPPQLVDKFVASPVRPANTDPAARPKQTEAAAPPPNTKAAAPPPRTEAAAPPPRTEAVAPPPRTDAAAPPPRTEGAAPRPSTEAAAPPVTRVETDDDVACRKTFLRHLAPAAGNEVGSADFPVVSIDRTLQLDLAVLRAMPSDPEVLKVVPWWKMSKREYRSGNFTVPDRVIIPEARIRARGIAIDASVRSRLGLSTGASTGGALSGFALCPGSIVVDVTCTTCRRGDEELAELLREQLGRHARQAALTSTTFHASNSDGEGECVPLPDLADHHIREAQSADQWPRDDVPLGDSQLFHDLLFGMRAGPAGFYAVLDGPVRVAALGTWHPVDMDPTSLDAPDVYRLHLDTRLAEPLYHPFGVYDLSVVHAWSEWRHVAEKRQFAGTLPVELLAASERTLIMIHPDVPSEAMAKARASLARCEYRVAWGRWVRYDALLRGTDASASSRDGRELTHHPPAPPATLYQKKGKEMTQSIQRVTTAGRFEFRRIVPVAPLAPPARPPRADCNGTAVVPVLRCELKRRVWSALQANDRDGSALFVGKVIGAVGESHLTQMAAELVVLSDGDLREDIRDRNLLPPAQAPRAAPNGLVNPFSGLKLSPPADQFHGYKPSVRVSTLPVKLLDPGDWRTGLNLTAVDRQFLGSDIVVFMLGKWRLIAGDRVDRYALRLARFILALHGLGPDAGKIPAQLKPDAVVVMATVLPPAALPPHRFDHRASWLDHRNAFSARLWGLMALAASRYVNQQLRSAGRQPVLALDLFQMFLPVMDTAYDGEHYQMEDPNLEAASELLYSIRAALDQRRASNL